MTSFPAIIPVPLVEYSDSDNGRDVNEVHSPQTFPKKEIQETEKPVKKRQMRLKIREEM